MIAAPLDPYFNDIPWEIIYDENGRVLAEIFVIPLYHSARRKMHKRVRRWGAGELSGRIDNSKF